MTDTFNRGNTLRTTLVVIDENGNPVDPGAISLIVKNSSGISITYVYPTDIQIVHDGTGIFYSDIVLSTIGIWEYEWISTNPDQNSGEEIYVEADPVSSAPSLASVADYARLYLGGQTWNLLMTSTYFGPGRITLAIDAVKRRVMTLPPSTALEPALNNLVLDYLGILTALELIPASRDAWGSQIISRSVGNDPAEITVYTDRAKLIDKQQDDLMRRLAAIQIIALPLIDSPITTTQGQMATDELYDRRVTHDPRRFPPAETFPYNIEPYCDYPYPCYPYIAR
jgi:hypothetical protein